MDLDPDREVGAEKENGGERGTSARTTWRRGTPRAPSSEGGETKEPWSPPLLSLGDVMLNPDPDQLHSANK